MARQRTLMLVLLAFVAIAAFLATTAHGQLSPAQHIIVVTPTRLLIGPWNVPIDPRPADMEAVFGAARECPGGKLGLLLSSLAIVAYLDDPSGFGCASSPPQAAVLGVVLRDHWRTDRGVQIGSTLVALRRAYPGVHPVRRSFVPQPGWWDSGLPFVHLRGETESFNCAAVELSGFPCAQVAFQVVRGRVAAMALRTGFAVG